MIKNIIFDYGEVIVNVDTQRTVNEFLKLTNNPADIEIKEGFNFPFFHAFERGHIAPAEFRDEMRKLLNSDVPDGAIDHAWNAMLKDLPQHRLNVLSTLKNKYRTFLLSNTNVLHLEALADYLNTTYGFTDLAGFFENQYYSNEIGMRKPDDEIFNFVLEKNQLKPEETLFLDDNPYNIDSAEKIGIKAHLVTHDKDFPSILKGLNLY